MASMEIDVHARRAKHLIERIRRAVDVMPEARREALVRDMDALHEAGAEWFESEFRDGAVHVWPSHDLQMVLKIHGIEQ